MAPRNDAVSSEYVSIIRDKKTTFFIKWDRIANLYTLEDINGEHVTVFTSPINNMAQEIQNLKDISKPVEFEGIKTTKFDQPA